MALPSTQEVNSKMDRKDVKALGISTQMWLVVFVALALIPVFNVVAIPAIVVAAVLALAIYVAYIEFKPRP